MYLYINNRIHINQGEGIRWYLGQLSTYFHEIFTHTLIYNIVMRRLPRSSFREVLVGISEVKSFDM